MVWQVTRSPHRRGRHLAAKRLGGFEVHACGIFIITFVVYHLPTNSAFAAKSIPLDQVPATLNLWLSLHAVRIALGLIASVVGLVAVAR